MPLDDAPASTQERKRPWYAFAENLFRFRAPRGAPALGQPRTAFDKALLENAHPPGVVPKDGRTLAMDDQIIQTLGWAAGVSFSSSVAEGVTWLGYTVLSEMAQRPEYRALSDVIASEMTREWIELRSTGEDDKSAKIKTLYDAMARYDLRGAFQKVCAHDGFFGRAHLYIDLKKPDGEDATDDRDELRTSIGEGADLLSEIKVTKGSLKGFRPVEPVWVYPTNYDSNDPLKPDWYKPNHWFVQGKEVHKTRLMTFVGREVPDLLKPTYSFGGLSMTQMAKPYVDNWLRTRQAVADLIYSFSTMVLKTDLQTINMLGGDDLQARVQLFTLMRNNQGLQVVNKESEDLTNVQTSLASLDALQAQAQEHMAAVSRIPVVKLLGIQPAGLNASSEGELRTFYDWIAAFQELLFRKHLTSCLNFIQLSEFGAVDPEITFDFKSPYQLTEKEEAEVQKVKADTHSEYVAMGAVTPTAVAEALAADPQSPYHGVDIELPPEQDPLGEMQPGEESLLNGYDPTAEAEEPDLDAEEPAGEPESQDAGPRPTKVVSPTAGLTAGIEPQVTKPSAKDWSRASKVDVDYERIAKDQAHRCELCEHFETPYRCERVDGPINAKGWCKLWSAKEVEA